MTPWLAAGVGVLAGAALAYQVVLTRVYSLAYWQPYAFLIISMALLGIGASGMVLSLWRDRLLARTPWVFAAAAAAFALLVRVCPAASEAVAFNPLEVIWDLGQQVRLLALCLVLAAPFFCVGLALGLALTRHGDRAGRLYLFDLLGSGCGALAAVIWLSARPAADALPWIAWGGLAAGLLVLIGLPRRRIVPPLVLIAGLAPLVGQGDWPRPQPSPYKPLSLHLTVAGAKVVAERTGPFGDLTVIESPAVPLRHAPGLSLTAPAVPAEQLGLFRDGLGPVALPLAAGVADDRLAYLDHQIAAAPHRLMSAPSVLVLGLGGGTEVWRALRAGAHRVDVVEPDAQLVSVLTEARRVHVEAASPLADRRVTVLPGTAREWLTQGVDRWDVIVLSPETGFGGAAGLQSTQATPVRTVEAVAAMLARLTPGGMVAMTTGLRTPPRDTLRVVSTALAALSVHGIAEPGRHLAVIQGWDTATTLIKAVPFAPSEITALSAFAGSSGFDLAYGPDSSTVEQAARHRAAGATLRDGIEAMLSADPTGFVNAYKFDIRPATDDRPYAHFGFSWRLVPDLPALLAQGGLTVLDTGYLVHGAALALAVPLSLVLILVPVAFLPRPTNPVRVVTKLRTLLFFLAIGLGFLLVEIAFIERLILSLGVPLHALGAGLAGMLVMAGLGAGWSRRFAPMASAAAVAVAAGTVAVLITGLAAGLAWLSPADFQVRWPMEMAALAVVSFVMGLPFPLALRHVSATTPGLVPWAWAINGCASVVGAVLATLIAVQIGLGALLLVAALMYAVAAGAMAWPCPRDRFAARAPLLPGRQA